MAERDETTGAELLRAARLMREDVGTTVCTCGGPICGEPRRMHLDELLARMEGSRGFAHYFDSWHPAVALAVADWLDDEAAWQGRASGPVRLSAHNPALAVARAYLAAPVSAGEPKEDA